MSDTDIKIKAILRNLTFQTGSGEVCYPIPSPYTCETLTCVPLQRKITSVSSSSACRSSTTRPKTSRPPTCPNYKPPPLVGPGDLVEVHSRVTGPSATGTSVRVTDLLGS
ncbi:hypothetical protein BCR44DRAFT_1448083 [Catenaria anguillulae PL171]|uniref:Uncharacterized protein n=1 Tax=Catenaria anguillulae PL171 TaxID=765915 RepID=A0A1Y2H6R9_9FUNG|nr:hypothetical protein BCR44DRAFT_1448083 [Catenaria anguillulae PL171]